MGEEDESLERLLKKDMDKRMSELRVLERRLDVNTGRVVDG